MKFLNFLKKEKIDFSNYYTTHKIGGLLIDVESILERQGFENFSKTSYLRNFVINRGEGSLPNLENYVVLVSKIGIVNNTNLVLNSTENLLPVIYHDIRDVSSHITHSLLGSGYVDKLVKSNGFVYNGLNDLV